MFNCHVLSINLKYICRIFHRHLDLLYTDQEIERDFTPDPMALFLVQGKLAVLLFELYFIL